MKKYKLIKGIATYTLITAISLGVSSIPQNQIPFTQEDKVNNIVFSEQLEEIMNEKIEFTNKELESIIIEEVGYPITKEKLLELHSLSIITKLNNQDLSELKYLPNLYSIFIYDNDVNLEDLKYNQNLYSIYLTACTITNSEYLPNTIEYIDINYCHYKGEEFIVPYYTKELSTKSTIINNIRLKNPSRLEKLSLYTDSFLDLNNIKDCTNLKELSLERTTNIKNPEVLRKLKSLEIVTLDEYATIWLDLDTLNTLPISNKEELSTIIELLDNMASSIISNPDSSPEEKARLLIINLLENYDYDFESIDNYQEDDSIITIYNDYPITTILETNKGVCVNYACLFTALANRVGIDTFQLFNYEHTWNAINTDDGYVCYDLSYLESGAIIKLEDIDALAMIKDTASEDMIRDNKGTDLYYYEFNIDKILDDNHIADYTPQEIEEKVLNIGYINDNSLIRLQDKYNNQLYKMNKFLKTFLILSLTTFLLKIKKEKQNNEKKLQKTTKI